MEKRTGNSMVNIEQIKYASLTTSRIIQNEHRFDASAYNIDAMKAINKVQHYENGYTFLSGNEGLVQKAFVGSRFKRIYTENDQDIPFFLPSDIENVHPKATKHISRVTKTDFDNLIVHKGMLLISCSGTIGKTCIVSNSLDNQLFSHDLLRVTFKNEEDLGFVYAFLNTSIGLTILQSNNYGAVIDHIEPGHLANIPIPNAPKEIKDEVHKLIIDSYSDRDQSNELITEAQNLLYKTLKLPKVSEIKPKQYDSDAKFRCFSLNMSRLDNRIDVSYHIPLAEAVIDEISKESEYVAKIKDPNITSKIILPGRFKRIYVDKEHGVPFFGGKQLLQLIPTNLKYLSKTQHANRIKQQLSIEENWCVVSCSGTIGKVNIVPKHWEGWTLNQHVLRLVPKDDDIAGYLYAWIESPYCKPLILRNSYGAVIDELDDIQMGNVPVPILKDKQIMKEINDKVLKANKLRYDAAQKESNAIQIVYDLLK